ncbi:MAG: hypothetical protein R3A44_28075 [Caldilineaceae bacterium]
MNAEEIQDFVVQIVSTLRELEIGWIVRHVAQSLIEENVADYNDSEVRQIVVNSSNPTETLLRLLRACEILIVETADMEQEIQAFIWERLDRRHMDSFVQNVEEYPFEDNAVIFSSNMLDTANRRETASEFAGIIRQVRTLIS